MTIVLASGSPRRIGYLRQLDIPFAAVSPDVDETIAPGTAPGVAVKMLAIAKAAAVRPSNPDATIIAADTVVAIDGEILGKPADFDMARTMFLRLQGRTHHVFTGLTIVLPDGHELVEVVETLVTMRSLDAAEIDAYVATDEPMDKAGSYGIQGHGAALIAAISGCYTSVAGLPVCRVTALLKNAGLFHGEVVTCGDVPDRPPASIEQRLPLC